MDSLPDPFSLEHTQVFSYGLYSSLPGSAPSAPRYAGGNPPSHPVASHFLRSCGPQAFGSYGRRHANEGSEESGSDREGREGEEHEEERMRRGAVAADFPALVGPSLSLLLPRGKRLPSCVAGDLSPDLVREKRVCTESVDKGAAEREEANGKERGRSVDGQGMPERRAGVRGKKGAREGRLRQRQELKVLLRETRGKLLELQERVWRAYGERWRDGEGQRAAKGSGDDGGIARDESAEIFSEEEEASDQGMSQKSPMHHLPDNDAEERRDRGQNDDAGSQRTALAGGSLWLDCGLVRGEWEAGSEGGPKFAQTLKQELSSAVARVIDRVTRLYAQSGPSSAADLGPAEGEGAKLENASRVNKAAVSLERCEALPLVLKRPQEKKATQNPSSCQNPLLPQLNPTLPQMPHSHVPALLPTHSKDPFLASFPPAPPPLPLPVLHYTMQHLFARSLSTLPLHKDCLSPDTFLDFSPHAPSFPPLPLMGQLDGSLPASDRDGGRRGAAGGAGSGYADGGDTSLYLPGGLSQEGLSPCHLKKAKLMFFYARYPSSNTLKTYFPDVKFNRCVTSQMIKWFSNFREFFYIQMERFARQAAREGLAGRGEAALRLGRDSELYRILNLHYNKSNDYQVPDRFVEVSELALREFLSAIQAGRDADPCWKKSIYKIICKLDSPVPDSFRLPGCPVGVVNIV
ncbi:prospero homeobox 3 [Scleropages formosus]|uniref:Prospero homeobox 3 n=1 Tax=Scleropages formosus TaxID=113540 RepID=A0A8C9RBR6_SCLFO|nr:prospero homeobox protein 1-like [Scleropages formosus]